ncbi:hypothetical protein [Archangium sp. Cb G35]|nr:hypothetical protein [Archangium sp. Cb G35]
MASVEYVKCGMVSGQVAWRAGQPGGLGVLPAPLDPEPLGMGY